MFLGGVPAQRSRGTFDPIRTAAKHRPASRKFRLDENRVDQVNEEKRSRLFAEIYRKQTLECYPIF